MMNDERNVCGIGSGTVAMYLPPLRIPVIIQTSASCTEEPDCATISTDEEDDIPENVKSDLIGYQQNPTASFESDIQGDLDSPIESQIRDETTGDPIDNTFEYLSEEATGEVGSEEGQNL